MSRTRRAQSFGPRYEHMLPRRHHGDQHDREPGVKEDHSRTRDTSPSPFLDYDAAPYDAPHRRRHRNSNPPPIRPHSSSPPRLGRHDDHSYESATEWMPRIKSKGRVDAPPLRIHRRGRSLSRPVQRSTDYRHYNHRHYYEEPPPYRSPSSSPERITHRRVSSVHPSSHRRQSSSERQRRHRSYPPPVNHHSDVHPHTGLSHRWQGAAAAAFQAGSLTALAVRSEPGPWRGSKGARVVTAAIGAGMIKAARHQSAEDAEPRVDRDRKGRKAKMKTKGANMVTGAVTGLLAKQFAKDHSRQ